MQRNVVHALGSVVVTLSLFSAVLAVMGASVA